jgi:hypothetical protein
MDLVFSGAGFSLWVLVAASSMVRQQNSIG